MDDKPHIITTVCTNQHRSKGGKTAAKNMTAEQKHERAIKASHSRKSYQGIPKATHVGELRIGEMSISCAVLEDGRRIITETSVFELLNRSRKGRKQGGTDLPAFLAPLNLRPFISSKLGADLVPFEYLHPKRGKVKGILANLIPSICEVYINAKMSGVLLPSQYKASLQATILQNTLAKVGLDALIDEATSYQHDRERDGLQQLLKAYISEELLPWTKKFPDMFFDNIKRMYKLEHLDRCPQFAGKLINRFIYKELSQDVLDELKKRNPITEGGYRKHAHHQLLTEDIGHPALEKQIMKVNTLMSASDSKEEFENLYEKTKR